MYIQLLTMLTASYTLFLPPWLHWHRPPLITMNISSSLFQLSRTEPIAVIYSSSSRPYPLIRFCGRFLHRYKPSNLDQTSEDRFPTLINSTGGHITASFLKYKQVVKNPISSAQFIRLFSGPVSLHTSRVRCNGYTRFIACAHRLLLGK